ncbi:MAG: (Fe-S)-binding protein [Bacteroidales bacterium]|jgi:Fe-S oxidoreductase|nr:(Fe-S)-binding protein [Bacteroidales bacterium]
MTADQKRQKALDIISRRDNGRLLTYLNSCVHCGLCADSCIFYLTGKNPKFIPARKVDLVASVYRRYNTLTGRLVPGLTGARDLDGETITEMIDILYGACTMCGRCTIHCSVGIDISDVVRAGRSMLATMDLVPETLQSTVRAAIETGNNMAIPKEDIVDTIKWLEEELQYELNDQNATIPLDEPGKKVIYTLNPREPKFFPLSISAMAKIFYMAGESWTLSTEMYDVTNYAYFSGDDTLAAEIVNRLENVTLNLGAGKVVLAECGHGSRSFRWEGPNYIHRSYPFEVLTSVELIKEYIDTGRIKPDRSKNTRRVTLHDPCNLVRGGGIMKQQRDIINRCVTDFVEMTPYGNDNYCCGGGGGQLSMSEYNERRMSAGGIKADQIRATGAEIVVTPCHNCVDQLIQINQAYKLNVQILTMAEIVADAL